MLTKTLALKIFEGFSIERWNDLVRPFELIEMDKAAEKMMVAYIIAKYEEDRGQSIDWDWMIHASFFELLRKIALCDIKSPVQRMIRCDYPEEYKKLNQWVVQQYEELLPDKKLLKRFEQYCCGSSPEPDTFTGHTAKLLRAAHKFSTLREFQMISVVNEKFRLDPIEEGLNQDIKDFLDLRAIQLLLTKQGPYRFLLSLEQLRFQTRWNQTPRVPRTSVLGHSFFVAILTLLLEYSSGVTFCEKRRYNNFFCGLFHDLPEAVTRDIISPVKQATDGLPQIVKLIEDEIVGKELYPLMDNCFRQELLYFTSNEFANRIRIPHPNTLFVGEMPEEVARLPAGQQLEVSFDDLNNRYNFAEFSPVDGRIVKVADHIAAFLEADSSIRYGITSPHLTSGKANLLKIYSRDRLVNGIDVMDFFNQFQ